MAGFTAVMLLSILPLGEPLTDHVTEIEINHYHDAAAKHIFTQHLFRQWNPYTSRYEIREWRLTERIVHLPGSDEVLWMDGGVMRRVTGRVWESWSQGDPEVNERVDVPTEQRRNLSPDWKQVRRVLEE